MYYNASILKNLFTLLKLQKKQPNVRVLWATRQHNITFVPKQKYFFFSEKSEPFKPHLTSYRNVVNVCDTVVETNFFSFSSRNVESHSRPGETFSQGLFREKIFELF